MKITTGPNESVRIPNGLVLLGLVIVLGLLFLATCYRVVGVGQVGVLTAFGQVKGEHQSGVVIKAPWESLSKFDIKTQKDQVSATAASADLQDVTTNVATNYSIDPNQIDTLYRTVGTEYKDRIIDPAIQDSIKAATSQYVVSDLITKRDDVAAKIKDILTAKLASRGITVQGVNITDLTPSAEYSKAIEQKVVAQQQAEQAQYNVQKAQLDAQANQVQQSALTDQILEQQAIAKWNGVLPTTVTSGSAVFGIPVGR